MKNASMIVDFNDDYETQMNNFLLLKPIILESDISKLEQWIDFDYAEVDALGQDAFDTVYNKLSEPLGRIMVVFSELEANLEKELVEMINDRSDHLGMVVIRKQAFEQKVLLYIDLLRMSPNMNTEFSQAVSAAKRHLIRALEIRNIVAHAKWVTYDGGYVFSSLDAIDSESGIPEVRKYKLDYVTLNKFMDYISLTRSLPVYLSEKYM